MTGRRALLWLYSTPPMRTSGWRGALLLALVAAIILAVPEARVLITVGFLGGVVLGLGLILIRHMTRPPGPRRGTPIVLFPRPVSLSATSA